MINGATVVNGEIEPRDMDTVNEMLYMPSAGLKMAKLVKITPEEYNFKFEDGQTFSAKVDMASGDLQLPGLPAELAGSETGSYEGLNVIQFWFNIRENIAKRVSTMLQVQ